MVAVVRVVQIQRLLINMVMLENTKSGGGGEETMLFLHMGPTLVVVVLDVLICYPS